MNESILESVKSYLAVESDETAFDKEIVMAVNTALMALTQIGVGPSAGFSITGATQLWTDIVSSATNLEGIKTYICLKTRLMFDPPTSSSLMDAINRQISELEFRISRAVEIEIPLRPGSIEDVYE